MKIPILKIPYSKKSISNIKKGLTDIIKNGNFTMSENVQKFEKKFSSIIRTRYSIAVNSGTSALEIIFRSINVENKYVIVPTNTFMATPLAVLHAGGKVIFCDIDKNDLCLSYNSLKNKIKNKNIAAVVIVHIGGIISANLDNILKLCRKKKIPLVEDCAHAHGSKYKNKFAGNLGIAGAFSFYPTKIINSAEGGIITTNSKRIFKLANILREHGKQKKQINFHTELGYNWRFSELHALLGLEQIKRFDKIINERIKLAKYYDKYLQDTNKYIKIKIPKNTVCAYYKYIILLKKNVKNKIKRLMLKKYKIHLPGEVYDFMCHKQPVFKKYKKKILNYKEKLPIAESIEKKQLCLPLYLGLNNKKLNYIIKSIKKVTKIV